MRIGLIELAQKYIAIIDKIEKTIGSRELQRLEEKRVELHWQFIDALRAHGIEFKDREHATQIAIKIAKGEQ